MTTQMYADATQNIATFYGSGDNRPLTKLVATTCAYFGKVQSTTIGAYLDTMEAVAASGLFEENEC